MRLTRKRKPLLQGAKNIRRNSVARIELPFLAPWRLCERLSFSYVNMNKLDDLKGILQ